MGVGQTNFECLESGKWDYSDNKVWQPLPGAPNLSRVEEVLQQDRKFWEPKEGLLRSIRSPLPGHRPWSLLPEGQDQPHLAWEVSNTLFILLEIQNYFTLKLKLLVSIVHNFSFSLSGKERSLSKNENWDNNRTEFLGCWKGLLWKLITKEFLNIIWSETY